MIGNIGDQLAKAVQEMIKPYQEQTGELQTTLIELNANVLHLISAVERNTIAVRDSSLVVT